MCEIISYHDMQMYIYHKINILKVHEEVQTFSYDIVVYACVVTHCTSDASIINYRKSVYHFYFST